VPPSPRQVGNRRRRGNVEQAPVQDVKGRACATTAAGRVPLLLGVRCQRLGRRCAGPDGREPAAALPGDRHGAAEPGPGARAVPGRRRPLAPASVRRVADPQLALGPGGWRTSGQQHRLGSLPACRHLRRRLVHRYRGEPGPTGSPAEPRGAIQGRAQAGVPGTGGRLAAISACGCWARASASSGRVLPDRPS
jgi:hypothetical protein